MLTLPLTTLMVQLSVSAHFTSAMWAGPVGFTPGVVLLASNCVSLLVPLEAFFKPAHGLAAWTQSWLNLRAGSCSADITGHLAFVIFGVIKSLETLEAEIAFCQKALDVDYTVKMSLAICILVIVKKTHLCFAGRPLSG